MCCTTVRQANLLGYFVEKGSTVHQWARAPPGLCHIEDPCLPLRERPEIVTIVASVMGLLARRPRRISSLESSRCTRAVCRLETGTSPTRPEDSKFPPPSSAHLGPICEVPRTTRPGHGRTETPTRGRHRCNNTGVGPHILHVYECTRWRKMSGGTTERTLGAPRFQHPS